MVLNWNGWRATLTCLAALDQMTAKHDVIVVDNGSTDDSVHELQAARPGLRLIETGANLGYAGGNNVGIRAAIDDGAEFVWILNNDSRPRPDALAEMIAAARPGVDVLTTRVEPWPISEAILGDLAFDCRGCEAGFHPVDMVLGPSLFFRSDVFLDVGLFDESYFHYFEEYDLVFRAVRGGHGVGLACRALVEHAGGESLPMSSPQSSYYMVRNRIAFYRKYYGRSTLGTLRDYRRALRAHLAPRSSLRNRDGRRLVAVSLAIADAIRRREGYRDLGERYRCL